MPWAMPSAPGLSTVTFGYLFGVSDCAVKGVRDQWRYLKEKRSQSQLDAGRTEHVDALP